MKIAIIGSGIAGNVVARRLHRHHEVTVFEAAAHIGGHTHTHAVEIDGEHQQIDTGFIGRLKRARTLVGESAVAETSVGAGQLEPARAPAAKGEGCAWVANLQRGTAVSWTVQPAASPSLSASAFGSRTLMAPPSAPFVPVVVIGADW